jgi:P27 family predicted phage terminase small subunit
MPRKGSRSVRKPPGTAVDSRNGQKADLSLVQGERSPFYFEPPKPIGPEAMRQWNDYWADPVSLLATAADRSLLIRWIENVDRYLTIMRAADQNPITRGSTHNDVANPLYTLGTRLEGEITKAEAQLGIGPKNRAALGIAVLSERRSLADLNHEYEDEPEGGEGGSDEDPRLKIISGQAES